ncbi:MAG: hypothetical protein DSM106950_33655 [Stigonema ocellatum SAG 48.90 = DSM 106950]|nr:hypothetical protein [Stigonema ocellatum SAG 48.90 = DSM 106950]
MDLSSLTLTTNLDITPVFGDNVQDLLGVGALNVNPSAIITVNSIADGVDDFNSGVTTLRDAINQANGDTGEDLIVFDRSLFSNGQTITLNLGELDITHNLDIIAPKDLLTGGDLVTVSGNKASRVFEIEKGATVSLDGLIVESGLATGDDGGGILNSGILNLDNSIVRNNSIRATGTDTVAISSDFFLKSANFYGAGIYNTGTLTVSNSTISKNRAGSLFLGTSNGGGIYNTGTLKVSNSTISDNSVGSFYTSTGFGGAIYNTGILEVSNSTINGNNADLGAGIYNTGILEVSNSTINGNDASSGASSAGGGIYNSFSGIVTLSNSTLRDNSTNFGGGGSIVISGSRASGGGIYNSGTLTVSNSTISGNLTRNYSGTAVGNGGGIYNSGTLTVSNSTISSNSVNVVGITGSNGGGIYNSNSGTLTLVFSTLTLNQAANGGGVYNLVSNNTNVSASARNTIIASNRNSANGVNPDIGGTFKSFGYNLIGDSTGSTGFDATGDIVGTSDNPIDPRLAAPDFNGGPTQTIALLPDSPAIDAADPTILDTDPTTDQRGFPRVSGAYADIGAFEF